ncbi:hypothetical protein [Streptomyces sp. YIM S03343]
MLRHGRRERVRLEEVESAPRTDPATLPGRRAGSPAHLPVGREAPLEDFERIAAQITVFRITVGEPEPGAAGM